MGIILRKYDLRAFLSKEYTFFKNLYYCLSKRFPLETVFLCEIPCKNIPEGTLFPHPYSIIIRNDIIMGTNCCIAQNVTIGTRDRLVAETPTVIGNNVTIYTHACIIGQVHIGDNAVIGAGAIVLKDVPKNTRVVGIWK